MFFDINAKIEEQKKESNQVTLTFNLAISTKPNVVKYSTSGTVTMSGKPDDIKKKLEVNPKTKIPQILFTIYQHVFNSIYMLSSNLNTPYPPPDLLHPMAEKIQILSNVPTPTKTPPPEKTETTPPATPPASTQTPSSAPASNPAPSETPTQAPAVSPTPTPIPTATPPPASPQQPAAAPEEKKEPTA